MLTHALLLDVQIDTLVEDDGAHIRITLPQGSGALQGQDALKRRSSCILHRAMGKEVISDFFERNGGVRKC